MGGGGENGHVNPGSARHVFPSVLDSHPLLWALVLTVRHGGWARSWIGSPGERSVAVAAKTGGTQLPPDTSRSGPRQRAGAVVYPKKNPPKSQKPPACADRGYRVSLVSRRPCARGLPERRRDRSPQIRKALDSQEVGDSLATPTPSPS